MERKILLTDTADEPGLIYKITEVCFLHGLNIIKNQEYVATDERRFFMRTYLEGDFNDRFLPEVQRKLGKEADVRLVNEGKKHLVVLRLEVVLTISLSTALRGADMRERSYQTARRFR